MASSPVPAKGPPTVAVDWIYIRYRTVLLLAGVVILAAALGLFWWAGGLSSRGEAAAVEAVGSAGQKVQEATEAAPEATRLPEARERASRRRPTTSHSC